MSRLIPSSLLTALTQPSCQPFFAIELMFDTKTITFNGQTYDVGPLRLWTGYGDRVINVRGTDQTFTGSGELLSINGLDEVNDLSAKNATLMLTGIPSEIISLALQEPYQRRPCRFYVGEQSVSDVVEIFGGLMNTMQIVDEAETSTIQLVVDSQLVELERSSNWRYTDENHKSRHAGDTFFSYVQSIQDVQVPWGRKSA